MVIGAFPGLLDLIPQAGATLAQAPWAAPPQLPAPPEIQHWLFERPLTSGLVLLAIALIAVVGGRAQGRARYGRLVGAGIGALAGLVVLVSLLVTTDREKVHAATEAVMQAIRTGDAPGAEPFFADAVTFIAAGGAASVEKPWIMDTVDLFPDQLQIEGVKAPQRRVSVDGEGLARSQLQVRGGPSGATANLTWWQFSWRRAEDGQWQIHGMDLLLLNGKTPDPAIAALIQKGRP